MDCNEARRCVSGYIDDEWELARAIEIEQHLRECGACRSIYTQEQASRTVIRTQATYYPTPPSLQNRIRVTLDTPHTRWPAPGSTHRPHLSRWNWLSAGGSLLVAAVIVLGLTLRFAPLSEVDLLTDNLVADHVRSLMANHIVDVTSSDQHTVKPWFNGRLDFSPLVQDLSAAGFPLVGGRLDYLNRRAVAALVYRRREHFINIFVWPNLEPEGTITKQISKQGYHLMQWTQASMMFWAVSDLEPMELGQFVQLFRKRA